jgi:hypothetical protein
LRGHPKTFVLLVVLQRRTVLACACVGKFEVNHQSELKQQEAAHGIKRKRFCLNVRQAPEIEKISHSGGFLGEYVDVDAVL